MKRDKLRIGVITAALAMMIAGGVLTWQQDARNGKADQAKQGETAQLTEDESTGTTEQQTEETAGDADGTRAVQDQADDVETVWNRCRKWKRRVKKRRREIQKQMQRRLRIHRKNQMGIQKDRTRRR